MNNSKKGIFTDLTFSSMKRIGKILSFPFIAFALPHLWITAIRKRPTLQKMFFELSSVCDHMIIELVVPENDSPSIRFEINIVYNLIFLQE